MYKSVVFSDDRTQNCTCPFHHPEPFLGFKITHTKPQASELLNDTFHAMNNTLNLEINMKKMKTYFF